MELSTRQLHPLKPNPELKDVILWALQYAILAPSAHNTQPWKWEIGDNYLDVYRDPVYTLQDSDPTLRETFLGIAAFIENFIIAAESQKTDVRVEIVAFYNQELHIARLTLGKNQTKKQLSELLFAGITQRHTNRGGYDPNKLPPITPDDVNKLTGSLAAQVFLISNQGAKDRIAELVGKGYFIALSMPAMKRELSKLLTSAKKPDGMGLAVESMTRDRSAVRNPDQWLMRKLDLAKESQTNRMKFSTSPLMAIIATRSDGPEAWINAGRLMERMLLLAAVHNLTHDISAAPIEIPTLAPLLRKEIDPNYRPQVLFRIGEPLTSDLTISSSRRALDD